MSDTAATELRGLSAGTANILFATGYFSREEIRSAVLAGAIEAGCVPELDASRYGEVLAWLDLKPHRVAENVRLKRSLPPLSQQMIEFVSPDFDEGDLPTSESAYLFYVMAWNLAVLPEKSPTAAMIRKGIRDLPQPFRQCAEENITALIARKRLAFPNDPRVVGQCIPVKKGNRLHLRVLWADRLD